MSIRFLLFLTLSLALFAPMTSSAQETSGLCPALVDRAFMALGEQCDAMDRNSACYGYNRVDATFREAIPEDFFTQPGDKTELTVLETIHTYGLDEAFERWGIALMRVQANIPNTLPGQAVVFMLLGESAAENAVMPEDALLPSDQTVDVQALVRANLRSAPTTGANVVHVAETGTVLTADALFNDLNWLRIVFDDAPAWVNREVVGYVPAIDELPVITPETRTPMQAFYFTTNIAQSDCGLAPDTLLIQGPETMKINLEANQASIEIGSTVLLNLVDEDVMQIRVLDGEANLNNLLVPEGFKAFAPLRPPEEDELEGITLPDARIIAGPWRDCEPMSPEELAALQSLEGIPPHLLNYPIDVPDEVEGNCSEPGAGGGQVSTVGACTTVIPGAAAGQADCCAFAITQPSGPIPYDTVPFAWNGAPGATGYQINIFTADEGRYVTSFHTAGAETQMNIFTPNLSDGSNFGWEVAALVNGQVACTTPRVIINRDPGGGVPPTSVPRSFCGDGICNANGGENLRTCAIDCRSTSP